MLWLRHFFWRLSHARRRRVSLLSPRRRPARSHGPPHVHQQAPTVKTPPAGRCSEMLPGRKLPPKRRSMPATFYPPFHRATSHPSSYESIEPRIIRAVHQSSYESVEILSLPRVSGECRESVRTMTRIASKAGRVNTSASRGAQSSVATTVEVLTDSSRSPLPAPLGKLSFRSCTPRSSFSHRTICSDGQE